MYNNQFYNHFLNPQYISPEYYHQNLQEILRYQQEQDKEVANVVKAVRDLCEANKKLDQEHQQKAFCMALAIMANEFGWD